MTPYVHVWLSGGIIQERMQTDHVYDVDQEEEEEFTTGTGFPLTGSHHQKEVGGTQMWQFDLILR